MKFGGMGAAVLVSVGTVAAASSTLPVTDRPPAGFTGGFGEPTCVTCHTGNEVNAFGGSIGLEGLPDVYEPGATYRLEVVLRADETSIAGFQVSARYADGERRGRSAGSWAPVDERTGFSDTLGVTYAHHNREGSATSDPGGAVWVLDWTAPQAGVAVRFHLAGNSGNGDNSPLGDLVFVSDAVTGAPPGVPDR